MPKRQLYILFDRDVSEKVAESLLMAMVYAADAETNGLNALNERLVAAEIAKLRILVDASVRNLDTM